MKRIASLLHQNLKNARIESIAGGSHFLPATHPNELAHLIQAHLSVAAAPS
jgi:pimeloyl-ACP methyl ester carboxylesterase